MSTLAKRTFSSVILLALLAGRYAGRAAVYARRQAGLVLRRRGWRPAFAAARPVAERTLVVLHVEAVRLERLAGGDADFAVELPEVGGRERERPLAVACRARLGA